MCAAAQPTSPGLCRPRPADAEGATPEFLVVEQTVVLE